MTSTDHLGRANASCLLACYMVLIQSWPPHLALAPVAQVDPPLMPFRDAGYSQADYGITVQDVVYGVWKAKEEGCCILENFDLDEYERFERVDEGDFNWITSDFVAFASPQTTPSARTPEGTDGWELLPKTLDAVDADPNINQPFKNVLRHFVERKVGLVVRLNSVLYNASYFEALGIQHVDMIFEDGTCPPLSMVRKFIRMAHDMITVKKKAVAVHCKAGLGRTGCLIGAYLIYRYGFTANEVISFMRFMRPGMVVGPQQHWLHLNQGVFREWWVEEKIERKLRKELQAAQAAGLANVPSTPVRGVKTRSSKHAAATPSRAARTPLSEIDQDTRDNGIGVQEDYLPAPTPGQPRKRAGDRHHPYGRRTSVVQTVEEEALDEQIQAEIMASQQQQQQPAQAQAQQPQGADSDEEWNLRMRAVRKASAPASPDRRDRAVSSQYRVIDHDDASNDIENIGAAVARTKSYDQVQRATANTHSNSGSASGTPSAPNSSGSVGGGGGGGSGGGGSSAVLTKVRGASTSPSSRRGAAAGEKPVAGGPGVREAGVRKTSGRIGSAGHHGHGHASGAVAQAVRKLSGVS